MFIISMIDCNVKLCYTECLTHFISAAPEENISEKEKAKKNNKIQRLSRLFANMRIKKKPNRS